MALENKMTTYEFYTTEFYGDAIDANSFDKWLSKATDKLQYLCFDNIDDEAMDTYSDKIQKAVCTVMDLLYAFNEAIKTASDPSGKNVKSVSSGSESVSFANTTAITNAMSSVEAQDRLILNEISAYLADTGLLYAGV